MEWCDENGVDFIFGLPGNAVLDRLVDEAADDIRTRRALDQKPCLRGFAETSYRAKSWNTDRRAVARIEATTKGLDIRFVVTSFKTGSAEHIYETLYCARGQAENLIKLHKAQLASDRTSCRSPLANQMRLILHTAAYWLILTVRDAIPNYISNSLWGVLRGPALGGFRCLPQCREQPAQLLGRERQCIPTLRIPLRQCIAKAPIPSELFPGDRLVNRKVHRNAA